MQISSREFCDRIKHDRLIPSEDCQYSKLEQYKKLKQAAVLIGLIDDQELGLSILLTVRSQHLNHHAGQISLPGGMRDQSDHSPVETALRETQEEVGIKPKYVEVVGGLDLYPTTSGFIISPIIARILPGFTLQADPFEVEEIFMVPLSFTLNNRNHKLNTYTDIRTNTSKKAHSYHQINYKDKKIWGITAAILVNLYNSLKD